MYLQRGSMGAMGDVPQCSWMHSWLCGNCNCILQRQSIIADKHGSRVCTQACACIALARLYFCKACAHRCSNECVLGQGCYSTGMSWYQPLLVHVPHTASILCESHLMELRQMEHKHMYASHLIDCTVLLYHVKGCIARPPLQRCALCHCCERCASQGKRVLELGCGHGVPGILAMMAGAEVHFQVREHHRSVLL